MGRGGKRAGAGRREGSRNRLTKEAKAEVSAALAAPITPLTVMRGTMEALWLEAIAPAPNAQALDPTKPPKLDIAKAMKAHEVAKDVAPYIHPKLQSIEGVPDKPLIITDKMSELERARRVAFTLVRAARLAAEAGVPAKKPAQKKAAASPRRRAHAQA